MAELFAHVGDGLTSLQEQRCECVPHLVRASSVQFSLVENLVEHPADVGFIERRPDARRKHPVRSEPVLEQLNPLATKMEPEHRPKLTAHVDLPPLMILRCGQLAAYEIAANLHVAPLPVEIPPLQREQLTKAHAGPESADHESVPVGEGLPSGLDHLCGVFARKRIHLGFGLVTTTEVPPWSQRWIRWQEAVFTITPSGGAQHEQRACNHRNRRPTLNVRLVVNKWLVGGRNMTSG
jgi:hypothetical protein